MNDASFAFVAGVPSGLLLDNVRLVTISGDYDADGDVDTFDYDKWKSTYGSTTDLMADGNGNNIVDAADYTVWRNNLGTMTVATSSSAATIPEPSSAFLLLVAALIALFRGNAKSILNGGKDFQRNQREHLSLREPLLIQRGYFQQRTYRVGDASDDGPG